MKLFRGWFLRDGDAMSDLQVRRFKGSYSNELQAFIQNSPARKLYFKHPWFVRLFLIFRRLSYDPVEGYPWKKLEKKEWQTFNGSDPTYTSISWVGADTIKISTKTSGKYEGSVTARLGDSCGFWREVSWEGCLNLDQRNSIAETYLGGLLDRGGNLQPSLRAFGFEWDYSSEEQALGYLRGLSTIDWVFLAETNRRHPLVRDYICERIDLDLSKEAFDALCKFMGLVNEFHHPSSVPRCREALLKLFRRRSYHWVKLDEEGSVLHLGWEEEGESYDLYVDSCFSGNLSLWSNNGTTIHASPLKDGWRIRSTKTGPVEILRSLIVELFGVMPEESYFDRL